MRFAQSRAARREKNVHIKKRGGSIADAKYLLHAVGHAEMRPMLSKLIDDAWTGLVRRGDVEAATLTRDAETHPRSEGGKRILLDNSRVYVRFLSFVSGRVHLTRISAH